MAVVESPNRYFTFSRVRDGEPALADIRRLRYDVYCLECRFLDPAHYPDGYERDEYDPYSIHCAATNDEHEVIATLRLVPDSPLGFPLEAHSQSLFAEFAALPRARAAEISRLILAKGYRRRAHDGRYGTDVGPDPAAPGEAPAVGHRRSPYPLILFGLFRQMFEASVDAGLEYWLAAMEPWLRTFLSRYGFVFTQIGEPIEYFGQVIPYQASIEEMFRTVSEMRPEVLRFFTGSEAI
jgi:N-acyl amino acid synthase of PEP-CTERM/exosortase system